MGSQMNATPSRVSEILKWIAGVSIFFLLLNLTIIVAFGLY